MTLPVVSLLFFGFGVLLTSLFVSFRRWDRVSKSWLGFSIAVSLYAFGYAYFSNNGVGKEGALFASRLGTTAASLIPVVWLNFVCAFFNLKPSKLLWISAPLSILFASVGMTPLFISSVAPAGHYHYYPVPGPVYHFHAVHFAIVVTYAFYLIARGYFQEKDKENRGQIFSLGLATLLGFAAGSSQFSLIYLRDRGVDLTAFLFLYPPLVAYAMGKHRVFDIEKLADAFRREKLAAVGILSASINHELKNPLFVARGNLDIGLRRLQEAEHGKVDSEKIRPLMEKSIAQLDRASELMQRLSDFARPELGFIRDERISVAEAFERVLELINYQFKLGKIRLTQQIDPSLEIIFNKRQFEEVLFNLIMNACQAMPDGGDLQLEAQRKDGRIQIRIQDSGKGINPSDRGKVFDAFYSTKGKEGTGLGLYITKQLLERRGGKIWFETSSKGTSFFVEFKGK